MAEIDFAEKRPQRLPSPLNKDPPGANTAAAILSNSKPANANGLSVQPRPTHVSSTERWPAVRTDKEEVDQSWSPQDDVSELSFPTALRRVQTAPIDSDIRPSALRRTTTLMSSLVRKGTGAGIQDEPPAPYPFEDESDSDSSGDDEVLEKKNIPLNDQTTAGRKKEDDKQTNEQKKKNRSYSRFAVRNQYFSTKGRVSKRDGRIAISINDTAHQGYAAKALGQSIKNHLNIPHRRERGRPDATGDTPAQEGGDADSIGLSFEEIAEIPKLNIVIMVIGSRGDIQPFIKLGRILQTNYGHRVRIASHPTFREFVEKDYGLEFFSVGGDPSELMSFMVKNPGLIPNLQTIREGEIQRRRTAMGIMFDGFWNAAISNHEVDAKGQPIPRRNLPSFVADAIIANPPSMAHVHIAEKLGIPLHMMFTFPYSPTQQFPHPLANVKPQKSNADANYVNFMSYPLVEMMTWQGLGDIVNRFRVRTLGLEPVSSLWAPGALYRMRVPYTYLWSPTLVPKPRDWGKEISIAGFTFLEMSDGYKPNKDLEDFLNAGEPPVYIGFGSIVVDDPNAFTDLIFEATKRAGVRALINKGWGGFGKSNKDTPDNIFMLGNTPHDWLFPRVKAVVHHGGAGTTAAGLKYGKPTMIVPFFGDQPFWGAMVADAKAGAHKCIPYKRLTVEDLTEGIKQCLSEEAQANVQKIAESIEAEGDGAENAVKSFHASLTLSGGHSMRCSILSDRVAVWKLRNSSLRLSPVAAEILHEQGKVKWKDLKLLRHYEWNDFDGPGEPITGGIGAFTGSLYNMGEGVGMMPVRIAEHIRKHEQAVRKKQERAARREERKRAKTMTTDISKDEIPQLKREMTNGTMTSVGSIPEEHLAHLIAGDVGTGFRRTGAALLTMPNDLHVAIARGFHNAPRLWGDATVRRPVRITGISTGFKAARREFVYGIWDGWTGVGTQPVRGFRDGDSVKSKLAGLGTGIGKGLGGFVLKNISAITSPPAYIGKGMIMAVKKRTDGSPGTKNSLRRAQIIRGHKDLSALRGRGISTGTSAAGKAPEDLNSAIQRVDAGWQVYQDIWDAAEEKYGRIAANCISRYKYQRDRRRWEQVGALDNVRTADGILRAYKKGLDMDQVLRRRERVRNQAKRVLAQRKNRQREEVTSRATTSKKAHFDADDEVNGTKDAKKSGVGDPTDLVNGNHKSEAGELDALKMTDGSKSTINSNQRHEYEEDDLAGTKS
ncbi:UDP-Glycosyltransferase/glycogen phosphorylase [Acrodontium crateriforme]|uniref:UDP-Glycosyltransferase/glycogen phosphorylase n=1 Tax=Acrodontium crateriforme TaxID=150365 RepID=A0AAQ3M550_9PEZI|nr:UDP-Glycosyltransferase/glycogen phosphorylase [Acrodontium crateriforme]